MAKHQPYHIWKGGKRIEVPSVTTILKLVGETGGLNTWFFRQGVRAVDEALQAHLSTCDDAPIKPSRLLAALPPYAKSPWDLPKDAAEIGTIVHAMVECDVLGNEFVRDVWRPEHLEVADVAYRGWLEWKGDRMLEVEACEERLVSHQWEYGGRQDLTALMPGSFNISALVDGGRRVMMDIKTTTGVYPNHIRQLAAYRQLWEENHPDRPIAACAILRFGKEDGSHHYHHWPAGSPVMLQAWADFVSARGIYSGERILKGAT